jgi:hypothetical protein
VKILFDANTPAPLARFCEDMKWCGRMNWDGRDWRTARCLTRPNKRGSTDFASRKLALVIQSSNHWPTLRRIAARIATAVDFVQTGNIVRVDVATL